MRYILWLEWDGFYVDREAAEPRVVLRDKRVLDANPAARRKAIRVGMDVPQVRSLSPECRFDEWRREAYEERQRAWLDVCVEFTGVIEPIDQHAAALDLSDHPHKVDITERLVRALMDKVRLPLYYGAAPSKWIAQLAAWHQDPGLAVRDPEAFLAPLRVKDLLPVAQEHQNRLAFLGYRTIGDVAKIPARTLWDQFGAEGQTIAQAARGGCFQSVSALYPLDLLREYFHFESPVSEWEAVREAMKLIADRIDPRFQGRQGSNVELAIEREDGTSDHYARRFTKPVYNALSMIAALRLLSPEALIGSEEDTGPAITSLRVTVTELEPIRQRQHRLLESAARPAAESAIRYVQNTFGEQAIRLASAIDLPRRERVLREWRNATGWL